MQASTSLEKPFFAQFLEKQHKTKQEPFLQLRGNAAHTLKYPSDGDEA